MGVGESLFMVLGLPEPLLVNLGSSSTLSLCLKSTSGLGRQNKKRMKKFIFLVATALTSSILFGQDTTPAQTPPPTNFTITKDVGLSPFIVVKAEGKTKEELYKKTIEWINKNYNKRSEVIKAQVENDYIRFQGVSKEKYCWDALVTFCNDIRYEVEVSFKDGKYKFEVLSLEDYHVTGASGLRVWGRINYKDSWTHFKNTGEVRKMYAKNIKEITSFFDELSKNLYDYIYNQNDTAKSNDW